ncbi:MAG: hypothetical protein OXG58_00570 [Gemmatimonadetes bacterium]|nr:hypothetical protein [Gemmatimonadota bacterium]
MNRYVFLAAAVLILPVPAKSASQTTLYLYGGLTRSWIGTPDELPAPVMQPTMGLASEVPFSGRVDLQVGVNYSRKGFYVGCCDAEFTTRIPYLELTTLVGTAFPLGDWASAHLLAGPALAFKLSCTRFIRWGNFPIEGVLEEPREWEFLEDCDDRAEAPRSIDLGLAGGLRFEVGMSEKMGLAVGAFYNHGLRGSLPWDGDYTAGNRTLNIQAGLAYRID